MFRTPHTTAALVATTLILTSCSSSDEDAQDAAAPSTVTATASDSDATATATTDGGDGNSPAASPDSDAARETQTQPVGNDEPSDGQNPGDGTYTPPPTDADPPGEELANGPTADLIPPGTYFTGLAEQTPAPGLEGAIEPQEYEVMFRYDGDYPGYTLSEVYYPTLGCAGFLELKGSTYVETITDGDCETGGTWTLKPYSGKAAGADYHPTSGRYTVTVSMMAIRKDDAG